MKNKIFLIMLYFKMIKLSCDFLSSSKYVVVADECNTTYNKIFLSLYFMDSQALEC